MSKVIEAEGCMVISDDEIEVVVIKKTNCSMREALFKAIYLISGET